MIMNGVVANSNSKLYICNAVAQTEYLLFFTTTAGNYEYNMRTRQVDANLLYIDRES